MKDCGFDWTSSLQDLVAVPNKDGNETWGSIEFGEFLDELRNFHLMLHGASHRLYANVERNQEKLSDSLL